MPKEKFKVIPTVYLYILKDNQIPLLRRKNTGFMDGYYSLIAGHLEGNETCRNAMSREAKEEAGIDINPNDLKMVHVIHNAKTDNERIRIFFTTNDWKGEIKNMEHGKCDDLSWFDIDNLPKNTIPYIKQAIKNIKNNIIYSEFGF